MSNITFWDYNRKRSEDMELPLRKVASYLDIDTSTLRKVERGVRPASPGYLKSSSEILKSDIKEGQTTYIADKITKIL